MSKANDGPQLGRLVEGEAGRDAIHVAVVPLEAGEWLPVGCHFRVEGGVAYRGDGPDAERGRDGETVGIVDPYLAGEGVDKGQRFWGVIYPNAITGLRHVWQHPAFRPKVPEAKQS